MKKHIKKEFLIWLAGFVDGDGSIYITLKEQKTRHSYLAINAGLNVTQREDYRWICEYIRNNLGTGKIYIANRGKGAISKSLWQTTQMDETVKVLKIIEPYLIIKKEQARKVIDCLTYWINSRQHFNERVHGKKTRKQKDVLEIVKIATSLNANMRNSSRYRGYKDYNYWQPLIEKWYPE